MRNNPNQILKINIKTLKLRISTAARKIQSGNICLPSPGFKQKAAEST
jgi:hypothetical protein